MKDRITFAMIDLDDMYKKKCLIDDMGLRIKICELLPNKKFRVLRVMPYDEILLEELAQDMPVVDYLQLHQLECGIDEAVGFGDLFFERKRI